MLLNDTEHIVKNVANTWKKIHLFDKPSDFVVSEKQDDDQENDEEIDDEEVTHYWQCR